MADKKQGYSSGYPSNMPGAPPAPYPGYAIHGNYGGPQQPQPPPYNYGLYPQHVQNPPPSYYPNILPPGQQMPMNYPGFPVQPQIPHAGIPMGGGGVSMPTSYMAGGQFEAGARFGPGGGQPVIPPPPPGYAPNHVQIAALQGQSVVMDKKKNNFFSGGKGAGSTFW